MNLTAHLLKLCLLTLLCLPLFGCSDGRPDVVPVKGKVTLGGKPIAGIIVHYTTKGGRPSKGITDTEGNYELHYSVEKKGARLGEHKIWFNYDPSIADPDDLKAFYAEPQPLPKAEADILAKYGQTNSLEKATVIEGENEINIDLK